MHSFLLLVSSPPRARRFPGALQTLDCQTARLPHYQTVKSRPFSLRGRSHSPLPIPLPPPFPAPFEQRGCVGSSPETRLLTPNFRLIPLDALLEIPPRCRADEKIEKVQRLRLVQTNLLLWDYLVGNSVSHSHLITCESGETRGYQCPNKESFARIDQSRRKRAQRGHLSRIHLLFPLALRSGVDVDEDGENGKQI